MIANMTAYGLARHWRPLPIYEALLEQDGILIPRVGSSGGALQNLLVEQAMTPEPAVIAASVCVAEALARLELEAFSTLPIIDAGDRFLGLVTLADLRQEAAAGRGQRPAGELVTTHETISSNASLLNALLAMRQANVRTLGVVLPGQRRPSGWHSRHERRAVGSGARCRGNLGNRSRRRAVSRRMTLPR